MVRDKSCAARAEGFSLIELLVVMAIVAILSGIAIPSFLHQREAAVRSGLKNDLHSVASEVESYVADEDQYPTSISQAGHIVTIGLGSERVTVGNSISYALAPGGMAYCLSATSPKGGETLYFVSDSGGLQPDSTVSCPF